MSATCGVSDLTEYGRWQVDVAGCRVGRWSCSVVFGQRRKHEEGEDGGKGGGGERVVVRGVAGAWLGFWV